MNTVTTPIRYELDLSRSKTHQIGVKMTVACDEGPLDLVMPQLSPGSPSNSLNQPARISCLQAQDSQGESVGLEKTAAGHWHLDARGPVTVSYTVRGDEFSHVRSYLTDKLAYIDGPSALMFVVGKEHDTPATVELTHLPDPTWSSSSTLLDVAPHQFYASSYDDIADSNILAGHYQKVSAQVGDTRLTVNQNGTPPWPELAVNGSTPAESLEDLTKLYTTFLNRFGAFPLQRFRTSPALPEGVDAHDKYVVSKHYLHSAGPNAGGYEHYHGHELLLHKAAGASIQKRFAGDGRKHERHIMAHELMHKLLAKSVRHEGIDSADLSKVGSTDGLWLSEGGVEWAGTELEKAAGLTTESEAQNLLQDQFRRYLADYAVDPTNGRENSMDAHLGNGGFYNKGAVTSSMLDLQLKTVSQGRVGFFDVLKKMKDEFGGNGKFWTLDDVERLSAEAVGQDPSIHQFFQDYLHDHKRFDFNGMLAQAGYALTAREDAWEPGLLTFGDLHLASDNAGQVSLLAQDERRPEAATLPNYGLSFTRAANGDLKLAAVVPGGPAFEQGLGDCVGQPLLDLKADSQGERVGALTLQFKTSDPFRGEAETRTFQVLPRPATRYVLEPLAEATPEQLTIRKAWLG